MSAQKNRLAQGGRIDRSRPVRFTFVGQAQASTPKAQPLTAFAPKEGEAAPPPAQKGGDELLNAPAPKAPAKGQKGKAGKKSGALVQPGRDRLASASAGDEPRARPERATEAYDSTPQGASEDVSRGSRRALHRMTHSAVLRTPEIAADTRSQ